MSNLPIEIHLTDEQKKIIDAYYSFKVPFDCINTNTIDVLKSAFKETGKLKLYFKIFDDYYENNEILKKEMNHIIFAGNDLFDRSRTSDIQIKPIQFGERKHWPRCPKCENEIYLHEPAHTCEQCEDCYRYSCTCGYYD